jgi:hypothetical protein
VIPLGRLGHLLDNVGAASEPFLDPGVERGTRIAITVEEVA